MSKIDYVFKSKIIGSQMLNDYRKISKSLYLDYCDKVYGVVNNDNVNIKKIKELYFYYDKNFPKEWKECARICNANRSKVKRLKDRISSILFNGDCLFLTLTFNNNSLDSLNAETRKDYVKRFLSSLECAYVANIDFGKKNHREHYHAVVAIGKIDYSKWKYGAIKGIKIRNDTNDIVRISKYIAKLTNHAIKETTKRCAIMYSRKY